MKGGKNYRIQSPPMTTPDTALRPDGRAADALRPLRIETGVLKFAEGSALIELGDTRVLVAASVDNRVPPFKKDSGEGWLTAEYSMLPRATHTRSQREVNQGRPSGRTAEIQRLIGRSLRAAVDLSRLPERTLTLDCDVLQADGGTRTAAVTGAYVAAVLALGRLLLTREISAWPIRDQVAAVSVGVLRGVPLLDLEYVEDQVAEVDMNVVATPAGSLIEIQGTGEKRSFRREEMDALVDLAFKGIQELAIAQNTALATTLAEVNDVLSRDRRRTAVPKAERDLWGRP
jgi:ribonuclease PH